MTSPEVRAFAASVAGAVGRVWPDPTAAADGDLRAVWAVVLAQGWLDLHPHDDLPFVVAAAQQLGRLGCPAPLASTLLARHLLGAAAPGDRPILLCGPGSGGPVLDGAVGAGHVLRLPPRGGAATLHPIVGAEQLPGMARPPLHRVVLGDAAVRVTASAEDADRTIVVSRLALAARALGAAARTHEMAVEHATARHQFGRPIGSFGAVQQRTADCQIHVSAGQALTAAAIQRHEVGAADWVLAAELATEHVIAHARDVQRSAHHTLAATGYFAEHPAPWLFRRVHTDVAMAMSLGRSAGAPVDVLLEVGVSLPPVAQDARGEAFRAEVTAELHRLGVAGGSAVMAEDDPAVVAAFAERGWLGIGWPAEAGGRGAGLAEQVALDEAVSYHRVPARKAMAAVTLLGGSILRHGTPAQQAAFLPLIRDGRMDFCLGYSEPEVGSDLASLRTRAVADGDHWVIDGQKVWTTSAHQADYVWLATRTDPDAPKRQGITVFLVPMDTPGIGVQPHVALSGEVSCTVTYDGVRVPDSARVGEVDAGWDVITDALVGERVVMGGIAAALHRQLDDLRAAVAEDPAAVLGPRGSAARARLGRVVVDLQAARALVAGAVAAMAAGTGGWLEAPMAAVLGGEVAEDLGEAMIDILGPTALLGSAEVPGGGAFEAGLRLAPMYVIGGGTNDIQRGLIARGLGLPR